MAFHLCLNPHSRSLSIFLCSCLSFIVRAAPLDISLGLLAAIKDKSASPKEDLKQAQNAHASEEAD